MKKLMSLICLLSAFAVEAAVSPLTSTNDYYYTKPHTTNIFGRVMGENGDYRLVRAEDIAFINEAWAERAMLASTVYWVYPYELISGRPLVKGWDLDFYYSREYLNYYPGLTTCACRSVSTADAMVEASGGSMTNIICSLPNARPGTIVSMDAITNSFSMLKKMNCLRRYAYFSGTNTYITTEEEHSWSYFYGSINQTNYVKVSTNILNRPQIDERGEGSYFFLDSNVYGYSTYSKKQEGSGTLFMDVTVYNAEDWIRPRWLVNGDGPAVVNSASAWMCAHSYYSENNAPETEETTVLYCLGDARWVGSSSVSNLVYSVDVDIRKIYEECASVAQYRFSLEDVESTAVVPESPGYHSKSIRLADFEPCILFIIRPISSLEGW